MRTCLTLELVGSGGSCVVTMHVRARVSKSQLSWQPAASYVPPVNAVFGGRPMGWAETAWRALGLTRTRFRADLFGAPGRVLGRPARHPRHPRHHHSADVQLQRPDPRPEQLRGRRHQHPHRHGLFRRGPGTSHPGDAAGSVRQRRGTGGHLSGAHRSGARDRSTRGSDEHLQVRQRRNPRRTAAVRRRDGQRDSRQPGSGPPHRRRWTAPACGPGWPRSAREPPRAAPWWCCWRSRRGCWACDCPTSDGQGTRRDLARRVRARRQLPPLFVKLRHRQRRPIRGPSARLDRASAARIADSASPVVSLTGV